MLPSNFFLTLSLCLSFFNALSVNITQSSHALSFDQEKLVFSLRNIQNAGYYFVMRVGEPFFNNVFEILLDISNPWTWIPDYSCSNCFRTNLHSTYYNCEENSKTCHQNEDKGAVTLNYPYGSIVAISGTDLIGLPSLPLNSSIQHTIGYAIEVTKDFYDMDADGILGLGISNGASETGLHSILNKLFEQKWIEKRIFSLFLTHDPDQEDNLSELEFGGFNLSRIVDNEILQTSPVANPNFWSFKLNNLKLVPFEMGEIDLKISSREVMLSTTFPDVGIPQAEFSNLIQVFKNLDIECSETKFFSNYICTCPNNDVSKFPELVFQLENAILKLPNRIYMSILGKNIYDESGNVIFKKYQNCVLGFRSIGKHELDEKFGEIWIFGMSIMRYYYTIFDMDNMVISFAPAKGSNLTENLTFPQLIWVQVLIILFLIAACSWILYKGCITARRWKRRGSETLSHYISVS